MVGETLANRYEILEKVGDGGMALVYSARDQAAQPRCGGEDPPGPVCR